MSEFNFKQYLKEGKLVKEDNNFGNNLRFSLKRGNTYSVLEPGMNEYLDDLEFIGYDMNDREYIFMDSTNIAPSSNDVFFLKVPDSEIEAALGRGDEELEEGKKKSLKENSDDYIVDQNAGYLIDQIADDMMYTEFDGKEDINKFIDSIIAGINKLKMEKIEQWEEANTEPDFMDPDFDPNLEEGRQSKFDKALKSASTKLAEGKKKKKKSISDKFFTKQGLHPNEFTEVVEDAMIEMDIDYISDISNDKDKVKKFLKSALKGMKKQNKGDHQKLKEFSEKEQLDFFIFASYNL